MGSLDTFVGKYVRLTDDLHEMRAYLNDIRICFIALTASCYIGIILYAFVFCTGRRRRNGDDSSSDGATRLRTGSSQRQRRNGRFDAANYDAETGGGGNTNEWDDMMPPPPNGNAVKTIDGYRYRHPTGPRASQGQGAKTPSIQNRLTIDPPETIALSGGKRQQLIVDNHSGTAALMSSSPTGDRQFNAGHRTPSDHTFRDGFIEKSPSIT